MYGFKFYMKVLWPTILCMLAALVGAIIITWAIHSACEKNAEAMRSAPCIDFNGKPIQEVPARCFQYFTEQHNAR